MKIKSFLSKSHCSREYLLYIYKEDDLGNKYFSKPITIEFNEVKQEDYQEFPLPALALPWSTVTTVLDECSTDLQKMLVQKDADKNQHIKDMKEMMGVVLDKIL